ncbi:hypothetical protein C8J56DRAFT_1125135 [Mycena floridula]|nr:hypothetical protein C8J56DRAFT_1125135 [Mycena floridula]
MQLLDNQALRFGLLFLLIFVAAANGAPIQLSPADPCENLYTCRRSFDIIWGCLVTLFACTWVAVHPNVPSPGQSSFRLILRRFMMMSVGIIAPEVIVFLAARQFIVAWNFSREHGVSMTHGFFYSMGGFVSRSGRHPITTTEQINDPQLGQGYLSGIRATSLTDIMDRSKGDALSKGVATLQCAWFITQCITRQIQHLPLTELEVATLAFATVNIFTWLLWWSKPLDVQCSIPIGPDIDKDDKETEIRPIRRRSTWSPLDWVLGGPITGDYDDYNPKEWDAVPLFWSSETGRGGSTGIFIELVIGAVFGALHCAAWNSVFPTMIEATMWKNRKSDVESTESTDWTQDAWVEDL